MALNTKLLVSPSPHIHGGDTVEKNMYGVIIALLPALAVSLLFFGFPALWVTVASILGCLITEFMISRYLLKRSDMSILDGSAILTGLLLALNLPSTLPIPIVLVGALVAIGIGKMSFGGLGNNIFNPAILGRVFLLISFPGPMATWPSPVQILAHVDSVSGATPLAIAKGISLGLPQYTSDSLPSLTTNLLGQVGGSMGEVSALALLIGFVYLLSRRIITWHIPVSILATAALFAAIMHWVDPTKYVSPEVHLLSGGMLLGAIYMATDYVTSPMSRSGMIVYGVLIALITMLIRLFGSYPEGMSFAILIMNAFTPLINTYMKPRLFGSKAAPKAVK